jgi:predicted DNA-binding transcriptional regulator AlpA
MLQQYTPQPERNRKKPTPNVAIEPFKVNMAGACALTGLSESAIRRAIKAGAFPAPENRLGCTLFDVSKLRDWAAS